LIVQAGREGKYPARNLDRAQKLIERVTDPNTRQLLAESLQLMVAGLYDLGPGDDHTTGSLNVAQVIEEVSPIAQGEEVAPIHTGPSSAGPQGYKETSWWGEFFGATPAAAGDTESQVWGATGGAAGDYLKNLLPKDETVEKTLDTVQIVALVVGAYIVARAL
jgi:hypothetical protein